MFVGEGYLSVNYCYSVKVSEKGFLAVGCFGRQGVVKRKMLFVGRGYVLANKMFVGETHSPAVNFVRR